MKEAVPRRFRTTSRCRRLPAQGYDPITRAEIIKMLVWISGMDDEAKNTQGHTGYEDQDAINDEDKGYLIVGCEDGIIGETDDNMKLWIKRHLDF